MTNPKFDYENEITGSYYRRPYTLVDFLYHTFCTLVFIAFVLTLSDLIFGAETVTNLLANAVLMIK